MTDPQLAEMFGLVIDDTGPVRLTPQAMHERITALAEHDLDAATQLIALVLYGTLRAIRDGAHTASPAALAEAALIVTGYAQREQRGESA